MFIRSFLIFLFVLPATAAPVFRASAVPLSVVPSVASPSAASAISVLPSFVSVSAALPVLPAPIAVIPSVAISAAASSVEPARGPVPAAAEARRLAHELSGVTRPVKIDEVVPGVYHLSFPSQRSLASAFVRFQEHYESPKFRGRTFSLEDFARWYAGQKKHARFSYFRDWGGFNIPSRVLRLFKKGDFDPLRPQEKALLAFAAGKKGRFYLIGTPAGKAQEATLRHETAHGLYYTNLEYRRRAQDILKDADLKPVYAMLERLGYHRSVWRDEAHAWLGDSDKDLRSEKLDPRPYREIHHRLLALYREYAVR